MPSPALTVAVSGPYSQAMGYLGEMLVGSLTFGDNIRADLGLSRPYDPDDPVQQAVTRERIHYYATEAMVYGDVLERPFAVISHKPRFDKTGQSYSRYEMTPTGELYLTLQVEATNLTNTNDSFITFTNYVGNVIHEIAQQSSKELNQLPLRSIEIANDPTRVRVDVRDDEDNANDFWDIVYMIEWGP